MNTPTVRTRFALVLAQLVFALFAATSSALACIVGTGTSASCTEAALNACLPGGGGFDGTVTFACGGAATITVTSTKIISADTTIDGGSVVTISGGGTVMVFIVAGAGVTLALDNRGLTKTELQRQMDVFANVFQVTEPLWNSEKWNTATGGK